MSDFYPIAKIGKLDRFPVAHNWTKLIEIRWAHYFWIYWSPSNVDHIKSNKNWWIYSSIENKYSSEMASFMNTNQLFFSNQVEMGLSETPILWNLNNDFF